MKYVYLLIIAACVAACKKDNNPSPGNPAQNDSVNISMPSGVKSHFIPNWKHDTLIGMVSPPNTTAYLDTIFSDKIGDTSVIFYKGIKYYVWTMSFVVNGKDDYEDGAQVYGNCLISVYPTPDTSKALSYNFMNIATPYKYYNESYQTWNDNPIGIQFIPNPPFPEHAYSFSSMNKIR